MDVFEPVAEELFKRQIKYKNGRYFIEVLGAEPERMNWFSSYYWGLLQHRLSEELGNNYYVHDYYVGKLTGHIFGSKISALVKTKSLVAPLISLIVKQFGYGQIKPVKTNYEGNWLTFEFYDAPVSREVFKYFGQQKFPIDYTIAGLVAGCAEQLIKRKFVAMETTCIACGEGRCVIETLGMDNFRKKLAGISNPGQKQILEKILELEEKTDFEEEVKNLLKNRNQKAMLQENSYLKEGQIL